VSRIDDLIRQHCPQGVEFRALDDVMHYEQPTKYLVSSTDYSPEHKTPVLTAGQTFVLGYTDETDGIYQASPSNPVIIFDDFTTAFKWVDFPFKAKSSAMKMLTLRPDAPMTLRFLWYAMQLIRYSPQSHARQWISTYSRFTVPLPPLDVQREIVRVLDLFQALEAELEAELEARRQQYAYYRARLLDFEGHAVACEPLSHVADFVNGKAHERVVDPDGEIFLMTSRFISTQGLSARRVRREDVLTPAFRNQIALVMSDLPNGRALARAFFVDADDRYAANQRVCLLQSKDAKRMLPRFLYYVVDRNRQLLSYDSGVDQTHLKKGHILGIDVPVPPLAEQAGIVSILDKFDSLVNDLSVGLPAELAARRKQYEFYRDRLLSFEEAA
jgi:type I restriction enzyme S subunit